MVRTNRSGAAPLNFAPTVSARTPLVKRASVPPSQTASSSCVCAASAAAAICPVSHHGRGPRSWRLEQKEQIGKMAVRNDSGRRAGRHRRQLRDFAFCSRCHDTPKPKSSESDFWAADLQFHCPYQNRSVPREFFDLSPIGHEYFDFVLAVSAEMIVQSFLADFAANPLFSVLPPKHYDFTIENKSRLRGRKIQFSSHDRTHPFGKQSWHPARR